MSENDIIIFDNINIRQNGFYYAAMGWYFHGQLESLVGYDIPSASVDLMTLDDGIYKGIYKDLKCTFFNWSFIDKYHDINKKRHRGFIVLNTDIDSLVFASKAYLEKRNDL